MKQRTNQKLAVDEKKKHLRFKTLSLPARVTRRIVAILYSTQHRNHGTKTHLLDLWPYIRIDILPWPMFLKTRWNVYFLTSDHVTFLLFRFRWPNLPCLLEHERHSYTLSPSIMTKSLRHYLGCTVQRLFCLDQQLNFILYFILYFILLLFIIIYYLLFIYYLLLFIYYYYYFILLLFYSILFYFILFYSIFYSISVCFSDFFIFGVDFRSYADWFAARWQVPVLRWLVRGPMTSSLLSQALFNDGLDCRPTEFVFIGIRNTKPWNHLKMCTFVLWTKIVAEFLYTIHPVIQVSDFVRLLLHV